jgi:hypothetical protein
MTKYNGDMAKILAASGRSSPFWNGAARQALAPSVGMGAAANLRRGCSE